MLNQDEFITRLHRVLEFYNLSAATFADEISVQRSSISHILSGRNKPSLEFILKMVSTYKELSFDWLLYGKGEFPTINVVTPHKDNEKRAELKEQQDLFSQETNSAPIQEASKPQEAAENKNPLLSEIERIVVFYKDGRFKEYINP